LKLTQLLSTHPQSNYPGYVYVVAEIGINHNGDISIAKQLIQNAADAGCDAVKFQKRNIDLVYSKDFLDTPRESPWGTTQRDQKAGIEFDENQFKELRAFTHKLSMEFSCSAWDDDSLIFLDSLKLDFNKVASALATKTDFLRKVANQGVITLLSLGMCTQEEADKAVSIFMEANCPVIPMHCVGTYPTQDDQLNLAQLPMLRERFKMPVGYSGHESSISPSITAASLGAIVIERHITLDRSMYGSDQSASIEQRGLIELMSVLRRLPKYFGSEIKTVSEGEQQVAKKLRYWEE
jgi:N-acetylneuraminate synthase